MQCKERLETYFRQRHVPYTIQHHELAYTAQDTAAADPVSGKMLAKIVMVMADGRLTMLVLPADGKIDFVKAAEADGFKFAQRLDRIEDLQSTIRAFMEFAGPAFLEVIIDPDAGVYPMVGPGLSYSKMITGDYIKSREKPTDVMPGPSEMF